MCRVSTTITIVCEHDRRFSGCERIGRFAGRDIRLCEFLTEQVFSYAPYVIGHIIGNLVSEFLVVIGHHMHGCANVWHIRPREAVKYADEDVLLTCFPAASAFHDVHSR